jgi:hypothetical protein
VGFPIPNPIEKKKKPSPERLLHLDLPGSWINIVHLSFASRGTVTLPLSSRHQAIELRSPVACWERGPEDDEGRGEKEGRSRDRYPRSMAVVMISRHVLSTGTDRGGTKVPLVTAGETTPVSTKLCCPTLSASTLSRTGSLESRPRKKKGTPPTTAQLRSVSKLSSNGEGR